MLMADTMAVFFVVLGLTLALVSLTLLTRGLWPDAVHAATQRAHRGFVVPVLIGIPVAAAVITIPDTFRRRHELPPELETLQADDGGPDRDPADPGPPSGAPQTP